MGRLRRLCALHEIIQWIVLSGDVQNCLCEVRLRGVGLRLLPERRIRVHTEPVGLALRGQVPSAVVEPAKRREANLGRGRDRRAVVQRVELKRAAEARRRSPP